jgi:hypothetical protein
LDWIQFSLITVPCTVQLFSINDDRIIRTLELVRLDATFPDSALGVKDLLDFHLTGMEIVIQILGIVILAGISTDFRANEPTSTIPVTLGKSAGRNPSLLTIDGHQNILERTLCVVRILHLTSDALVKVFNLGALGKRRSATD